MSFPNIDWTAALRLPTRVMIGLAIASTIVLLLESTGVLSLTAFAPWARPLAIVVLIVTGSLAVTGIGGVIYDAHAERGKRSLLSSRRNIRRQEENNRQKERDQAALQRIAHLSPEELRLLADSLRKESQSFYAWVHSSAATTLATKGIVNKLGGQFHGDYWPYTIRDAAWTYLLEHKDEILERDAVNKERELKAHRGRQRRS